MNIEKVVGALKSVAKKLPLMTLSMELSEELYWTVGPDQGFVPKLNFHGKGFSHWLGKFLNGYALLIFALALQTVLHFTCAAVLFHAAYKESDKERRKEYLFSALKSFLSGLLALAVGACVLAFSMKMVMLACCIQSGYELVREGKDFFFNVIKYFQLRKEPQSVANDAAIALIKSELKESGKDAIMPILILALTALSFAPIPIVANLAQIGLLVVAVYTLVQAFRNCLQDAPEEGLVANEDAIQQSENSLSPSVELTTRLKLGPAGDTQMISAQAGEAKKAFETSDTHIKRLLHLFFHSKPNQPVLTYKMAEVVAEENTNSTPVAKKQVSLRDTALSFVRFKFSIFSSKSTPTEQRGECQQKACLPSPS